MDNPLKIAKDGLNLVGEVMKAAGENPDVRAAGGELGKSALTVTKFINNALLPIAAVNFAFDKAQTYFSGKFEGDLRETMSNVPPDQIIEPKASIAGPVLQGLAFSHEEPNLKELYLRLLSSAMDKRASSDAHPAFVEVIHQLDAEEARLVRYVVYPTVNVPLVEVRLMVAPSQFRTLLRHLTDLRNRDGSALELERFPAMVDNWLRLGLVEVAYDRFLAGENTYNWVESRPEYVRLCAQHETEQHKVTIQKGTLSPTAFGRQFARAVGITDPHTSER